VPRLTWEHLETGSYHAALVSGRFRPRSELHTHEFFEMMYVLSGSGSHSVNHQIFPLRPGDLLFIRPDDCHAIASQPGSDLQFVNIAFPEHLWTGFRTLAQVTVDASWRHAPIPPTVRVAPQHRDACQQAFHQALSAFHRGASRLELCRFWALTLPYLIDQSDANDDDDVKEPPWLRSACWSMRDENNLRIGLPRFVALSGVSPAHLSRTLRSCRSETPTQFVNRLRVERAALLLASTADDISRIAVDCGFQTLPYFYRLFVQRYGRSPRVYRLQAQRAIVPAVH
jgi:AraC-like DNA-binding protein/quercetin dioxygenase-like cupin family protein